MKRCTSVLLCALLCLVLAFSSCAPDNGGYSVPPEWRISALGEKACMDFLSESGIEIPAELGEVDIVKMMSMLEDNLDLEHHIAVSWDAAAELMKEVRCALLKHHGLPQTPTV